MHRHIAVKGIEWLSFDRAEVQTHVRTTLERGVIENGTFVSRRIRLVDGGRRAPDAWNHVKLPTSARKSRFYVQ